VAASPNPYLGASCLFWDIAWDAMSSHTPTQPWVSKFEFSPPLAWDKPNPTH
jgi:hypothetical protein